MNIIEVQNNLKDLSDQQLMGTMNTGAAPQYLVLGEMQRRKDMRARATNPDAAQAKGSVAEDLMGGITQLTQPPQAGPGLPQGAPPPMAGGQPPMPPQAQSAPPAKFNTGGIVALREGGKAAPKKDPKQMSEAEIASYLADLGYTPEAVAGILGNIAVETGDSFRYDQQQKKGGNGWGLFQFDFKRDYYEDWLDQNKLEDSAKSQIDFMHDVVYGDSQDIMGRKNAGELRTILEAGDPEQTTKGFMDYFEQPGVPHLERRLASAERLFPVAEQAFAPPAAEERAPAAFPIGPDTRVTAAGVDGVNAPEMGTVNSPTYVGMPGTGIAALLPNLPQVGGDTAGGQRAFGGLSSDMRLPQVNVPQVGGDTTGGQRLFGDPSVVSRAPYDYPFPPGSQVNTNDIQLPNVNLPQVGGDTAGGQRAFGGLSSDMRLPQVNLPQVGGDTTGGQPLFGGLRTEYPSAPTPKPKPSYDEFMSQGRPVPGIFGDMPFVVDSVENQRRSVVDRQQAEAQAEAQADAAPDPLTAYERGAKLRGRIKGVSSGVERATMDAADWERRRIANVANPVINYSRGLFGYPEGKGIFEGPNGGQWTAERLDPNSPMDLSESRLMPNQSELPASPQMLAPQTQAPNAQTQGPTVLLPEEKAPPRGTGGVTDLPTGDTGTGASAPPPAPGQTQDDYLKQLQAERENVGKGDSKWGDFLLRSGIGMLASNQQSLGANLGAGLQQGVAGLQADKARNAAELESLRKDETDYRQSLVGADASRYTADAALARANATQSSTRFAALQEGYADLSLKQQDMMEKIKKRLADSKGIALDQISEEEYNAEIERKMLNPTDPLGRVSKVLYEMRKELNSYTGMGENISDLGLTKVSE